MTDMIGRQSDCVSGGEAIGRKRKIEEHEDGSISWEASTHYYHLRHSLPAFSSFIENQAVGRCIVKYLKVMTFVLPIYTLLCVGFFIFCLFDHGPMFALVLIGLMAAILAVATILHFTVFRSMWR